jgi:hypothetical protein
LGEEVHHMNIEGSYKLNIEQSARKSVEGLLATTKRLLTFPGVPGVSNPPDKEEHIQKVIAHYRKDQDIFDSFKMVVAADRITVSSVDGEEVYLIKSRRAEGDSRVVLTLDNGDEYSVLEWDVTMCADKFFVFESDDAFSQFVFERV